jgi:hypothetical protein
MSGGQGHGCMTGDGVMRLGRRDAAGLWTHAGRSNRAKKKDELMVQYDDALVLPLDNFTTNCHLLIC